MSREIKTVVLYHRGCNDGLASAWAASKVLPEGTIYLPYQYGEDLPQAVWHNHLIMVDLSPTPEQLALLYPHHIKSILIIDHHKTAIDKLGHLMRVYSYNNYMLQRDDAQEPVWILADSSHSGAVLTWAFFNNCLTTADWTSKIPQVLEYIEDYDLWKFNYGVTMPVNTWLLQGPSDFKRIDEMIDENGDVKKEVIEIGLMFMAYDQSISKTVRKNYVEEGMYQGRKFAIINGPHHLRNIMCDALNDTYEFSVCYSRRANRTVFSMRSVGPDVAIIAERFGGGGHAKSAAFSLPNTDPRLTDIVNIFKKPSIWRRFQLAAKVLFAKGG
jgi:oligoribonuclease NrnB/cAMP/cGMP phosphodiesterase (DHH superfamily)